MKKTVFVISNNKVASINEFVQDLECIEASNKIIIQASTQKLCSQTFFKIGYAYALGKKIINEKLIFKILFHNN